MRNDNFLVAKIFLELSILSFVGVSNFHSYFQKHSSHSH